MAKTMTYEEAKSMCDERLKYCANLYGAKYVTEGPFLKTCRDALDRACNDPENIIEDEAELIGEVFENYYQESLYEIAQRDEVAESIFVKLGLLEKID